MPKKTKPKSKSAKASRAKNTTRRAGSSSRQSKPITLLVGTRKGAFFLRSNGTRSEWKISKPTFLGHIIYHIVAHPQNKRHLLMAAKTGHLGPTAYVSKDAGKSWQESSRPPAFPKVEGDENARAVENVFWISPGHDSQPHVWYAGTSPPGLFKSQDGGDTWEPLEGFNNHPMYPEWTKSGPTPGGQMVHSVRIDPRDPNHIYLGISVGGVFETMDGGQDWHPLNKGCAADFQPDPDIEYGHDPHCLIVAPGQPDRLYQQNHCGIYRMDRPSGHWTRIGDNMPKAVGDIGFPVVAHHADPDCIWVFPMDGSTVWPRTSPGGKPATFISRNAGKTWKRQSKGFPEKDAYFTVKRQAMSADNSNPVGIYIGTTGGEIWGSRNEGESWSCLVRHLPEIYSLQAVDL